MGRRKKTLGQASSSVTPGNSSIAEQAKKEQLVTESVEEMNGTVAVEPVVKENQIQAPVTESLEKGNHVENAQLICKRFTAQNRISDTGMSLKFVAPVIVNGDRVAKLDKIEIEKQSECWMNAVVVYVVGQNPTLNSIYQYINSQWGCKEELAIFKHDEGFLIVRLKSREERDKVLYTRPHLFYGKPMIIKHWCANFNFHDEILKVIPILVKFPNLPLSCWGEDSLSRIGSILGVPLYADECTSKGLRVSLARILVELDITQDIPREVAVEDPNGQVFKQNAVFDWRPHFCKKCQMLGHNSGYECEGSGSGGKTRH
ncbi:uncharacterized protein LOC104897432 [Beta vulgaris subsp. vulgaris]|uniref:uncharacterized protein LOC104897432 n=1 Tax=Beta vulgaris subsp. vulgaris TaxID=3555 RepID=UPI00053FBD2E|nr:uncharacterized protein LOC104897432 [Beta vulgaris subsp. vulgaris]